MSTRVEMIRKHLEVLEPHSIDIVDESHLHAGHPGAQDGRGHFRVRIVSNSFAGRSLLERHRLVYAAVATLMQTDIHALAIEALTQSEVTDEEMK